MVDNQIFSANLLNPIVFSGRHNPKLLGFVTSQKLTFKKTDRDILLSLVTGVPAIREEGRKDKRGREEEEREGVEKGRREGLR